MSNQITLSPAHAQAAETLDGIMINGVACRDMATSFAKVFSVGQVMYNLSQALTEQVMESIMYLQGNPLGFRTDKDTSGGYNLAVVRDALISATMTGLMPVGNQFNIIGGRMYVTKEGFTYLLSQMQDLRYSISPSVPEQHRDNAIVTTLVKWTYKGEEGEHTLTIPVRVNKGMGDDAVLGKADRKAKCWLFNHLTSMGISDADVQEDAPYQAETRNVTPSRSDAPTRSARARGGLRGAPASATPAPAVSAVSAVSAPVKTAPVAQATPAVSPPAPAPNQAPALNLDSAQDDVCVTSDMNTFINELKVAHKNGNKNATTITVRNWMRTYLNMPDLDMPVRGMLWQSAIDLVMSNYAAQFDAVFGTSFAGEKGGVA